MDVVTGAAVNGVRLTVATKQSTLVHVRSEQGQDRDNYKLAEEKE